MVSKRQILAKQHIVRQETQRQISTAKNENDKLVILLEMKNEIAQSAEMCVIGSILIDEKTLVNVVDTLKPEHFYFNELKESYKAILELSSEGKAIDFISVLKRLTAKGVCSESEAKK